MSKRHLVTGATGFVGGGIALELLGRTSDELVFIARPAQAREARDRVLDALRYAASLYGVEHDVQDLESRCHVIAGDITKARCGVSGDEIGQVSHVWHAAASLRYEDDAAHEVLRNNVSGTQEILRLAEEVNADTFNYISTAYVAGTREGVIKETLSDVEDLAVNNVYEESKVLAEQLVADAPFRHVRILRPSVVIGHSRTYGATAFTGMYGVTKNLRDLQLEVSQRLGRFLSLRPLRLRADPTAPLDLIPVDVVARNAVSIGTSECSETVFHLTNASPPSVGEVAQAIVDALGMRTPRFVDSDRQFTSIDGEVDARFHFYRSYIGSHKHFDRSHTELVVGAEASDEPLPLDRLSKFVAWHVSYMSRSRAFDVPARAS